MQKPTILFLQGPASPFLRHAADAVEARGGVVHRIVFCLGDAMFWWPRRADWYRGRSKDWPVFLKAYLERHTISDIVMLGDGRPVHAAAVEVAMDLGVRIHILEHGYLRPDWLTLEPDGMSAFSRFPQDSAAIAELARSAPSPLPDPPRYPSSFLTYAIYDLAFHIPNVALGWLLHPHYRTHGPVHPLVEYSGWIRKGLTAGRRRRATEAVLTPLLADISAGSARMFLFPLQLPGDYQIRVHAPGGDMARIAEAVIDSFALHAPASAHLLFKIHPIDNGLSGWHDRLAAAAERASIGARVHVVDGGNLDTLLAAASGVVTVNSTVGITALKAGRPVIALGAAIYDSAGLTHSSSLATFWTRPEAPDRDSVDRFERALIATIQLRGGFIGADAIRNGAEAVAKRLLDPTDALPAAWRKSRQSLVFQHADELFGSIS